MFMVFPKSMARVVADRVRADGVGSRMTSRRKPWPMLKYAVLRSDPPVMNPQSSSSMIFPRRLPMLNRVCSDRIKGVSWTQSRKCAGPCRG